MIGEVGKDDFGDLGPVGEFEVAAMGGDGAGYANVSKVGFAGKRVMLMFRPTADVVLYMSLSVVAKLGDGGLWYDLGLVGSQEVIKPNLQERCFTLTILTFVEVSRKLKGLIGLEAWFS